MSRKSKATHAEAAAKRQAEDKRRKSMGLIPKTEEELAKSDRSLAKRLGLSLPEPSPPDPDATVFSRQGLLLPPFSRHNLTVVRRK